MPKFAMIVHGGASHSTPYLKENLSDYEEGLQEALQIGTQILEKSGSALKAVEAAVIYLEDNPLFNAGRGSALNKDGEVEMDAAIMDGATLAAGAVSMVRMVKNPIVLARTVMKKTSHVFLSGYGALKLGELNKIDLEPESYFVTDYQSKAFLQDSQHETIQKVLRKKNARHCGGRGNRQKRQFGSCNFNGWHQ